MKPCPNCEKSLYDYAQKCDGCGICCMVAPQLAVSPVLQNRNKIEEIYNLYCKKVKQNMNGAEDIILDFYYEFLSAQNMGNIANEWIASIKESPDNEFQQGAIYALGKVRDFFFYMRGLEKEMNLFRDEPEVTK